MIGKGVLAQKSLAQQMILVLLLTQLLLLVMFFILDYFRQSNVLDTAGSSATVSKLSSLMPLVNLLTGEQIDLFHSGYSRCHQGYRIAKTPFQNQSENSDTKAVSADIAKSLGIDKSRVKVGLATLSKNDFSYGDCGENMLLPLQGAVISIRLNSNSWLHAEVHPHEWHFRSLHSWVIGIAVLFMVSTLVGALLIQYLTRPLKLLSSAAQKFADGIHYSPLKELGSSDIRQTIKSFNEMQHKVSNEVSRRTDTLAALSHDIRTPLTSLRIKAELVEDDTTRTGLIRGVEKIERITAMALDYLRGDNINEKLRKVDLKSLVSSECEDFNIQGYNIKVKAVAIDSYYCRPVALTRALRNLIENSVKYGSNIVVTLSESEEKVLLSVADNGPGIPEELWSEVVKPFYRGSEARESSTGGTGLGLAVVSSILEDLSGELIFSHNKPAGLVVTIALTKS